MSLVLSVPLPLTPVKSPSPSAYGWGSSFYFGDDDFSEDFRRNGYGDARNECHFECHYAGKCRKQKRTDESGRNQSASAKLLIPCDLA